jgi:cellulose synthase/poly-beta-1,6-N-acetylglucosamine synthase-like glycosyltransferase
MKGDLTLAIPCRADEPGLTATLESLLAACQHPQLPPRLLSELLICINGLKPGEICPPLVAVRDFCNRQRVPMEEVWLEPSGRPTQGEARGFVSSAFGESLLNGQGVSTKSLLPSFLVLLTERKGKPSAWNTLWHQARGRMMLFCDADVRIESSAVSHLYARLRQETRLSLVAAQEVPVLQDGGTWWSRMGAIPYRFDFGNAGGRLYLIRKDALASAMPEDLLLEDAWLTVAVGKHRVAKELRAHVFFLPPATWRDYFAERVRTEGGKLQLARMHQALLAAGPVAQYDWSRFWQEIALHEYPLVGCAAGLRILARLWARMVLLRKDFYALYRPFSSTKGWMVTRK